MEFFETKWIRITDDKYKTVSSFIRDEMWIKLYDDTSTNEDLINLAYDLQLIESAHGEGIPVYYEDDLYDTIERLVDVMQLDRKSVVHILDGKDIIVDGTFIKW